MTEEQWVILKADIDDVNKKLDSLTGKTTQTTTSMQNSFTTMATQIASALGIAFSVRTLINFGKQSVSTFADVESSAMILANTLKNIGVSDSGIKSVEDFIKNLEQTKYFTLTEINEAFGNAAIKLRDVDIATKAVTTSMEIARARNIPLSEAVQRLTLGLMGNSRGLRDLGINIKDYQTTLDASGEATLDASTQLEILGNVMDVVGGSTEKFGETTKASLAKATTAWQDFKAEFGKGMDVGPTASAWGTFLNYLTKNLKEVQDYQESLKPKEYDTGWKGVIQYAKDFAGVIRDIPPIDLKVTPSTVQVITDLANGLQGVKDETDKASNSAKAFKASWASIKIEGLNLPELTKFVGNLNMAVKIPPAITPKAISPIKIDIGGTLNINVGGRGAIEQGIAPVVKQGIISGVKKGVEEGLSTVSHGAGWYSNRIGGS
jgi:hypothetical protein